MVCAQFQTKLQEDFDTVQVMLEDKEREIEQLTKELTDRSPTAGDEHAIVVSSDPVENQISFFTYDFKDTPSLIRVFAVCFMDR